MHPMLVYSVHPATTNHLFEAPIVLCRSPHTLFQHLRAASPPPDRLIYLEPGDATRYIIGFLRHGTQILMSCKTGRSFAIWVESNAPIDPEGLMDLAGWRRINPVTVALCCDVFNITFGHQDSGWYYDWEQARLNQNAWRPT